MELCNEAGLVWGEELYFDSTKVLADVAFDRLTPRLEWEAQQHLQQLFETEGKIAEIATSPEENLPQENSVEAEPERAAVLTPLELVEKCNGERLTRVRTPSYERLADQKVCPIDPDASPMQPSGGGAMVMGYSDHYIVDGGKHRVILHALVTPASIMDNTPLLDLVRWVCARWQLKPKRATGDTKYGTVPNIVGIEQMGMHAYLPSSDFSQRTKFYPVDLFQYDAGHDQYICPQGQVVQLSSRCKSEQVYVCAAKAAVCDACPVKSECTDSKSGRHIFRSFFQEELDRAKAYQETEAYLKAMRKRAVWTEALFEDAKQYHKLRRFRLRGLMKVNIEGVLIAAGQNLKRLIKVKAAEFLSFFKRTYLLVKFPQDTCFFNRLI